MALLNAIKSPTNVSNTDDVFPGFFTSELVTLADGGFVLVYVDTFNSTEVIWTIFTAAGAEVFTGGTPVNIANRDADPDVVALSDGGFALTWSVPNATHDDVIVAAAYDETGTALAATFPVSNPSSALWPQATALANDTYALTWTQTPTTADSFYEVYTAVYDAQGNEILAPVLVSTDDDVSDQVPKIATLANGNYALSWNRLTTETGSDIYTRVYTAAGVPLTGEILVGDGAGVEIAALETGGYALTFVTSQVMTAVYDNSGALVAAPVTVAVSAGGFSQIAALENGNYALFWSDGVDAWTAVYNDQGEPVSVPVNVTVDDTFTAEVFEIVVLSNGAYALTWTGETEPGSVGSPGTTDIFVAVYDAQGQEAIAPVNVSNTPGLYDTAADLTALADGAFTVAWQGTAADGFLGDQFMAVYQFVEPLNVILAPVTVSTGNVRPGFYTSELATLADGSFVLVYVDQDGGTEMVWTHFTAQGVAIDSGGTPAVSANRDRNPDVVALSGGGFALTWSGTANIQEIKAAVYDENGVALVAPFDVNDDPNSFWPQATALANDAYALTWYQPPTTTDAFFEVYTAVYNANGDTIQAPLLVSTDDDVSDATPKIATLANGNYALSWTRLTTELSSDIYTRVYTAAGAPVTAEILVGDGANVEITALSTGGYALTFATSQVMTAVYDNFGALVAAPVAVASAGGDLRIAALENGNYALFWSDGVDAWTAVYNDQGVQVSVPVNVTVDDTFTAEVSDIVVLSNGAYALTWRGATEPGSVGNPGIYDIFIAVYDALGQEAIAPVNVSNSPGLNENASDLTALANGAFAVAWQDNVVGQTLGNQNIAVYQFVAPPPPPPPGDVVYDNTDLIELDLSGLIDLGGSLTVTNNGELVTLDLSALISIGGNFTLSNNGALLTISVPNFATVGGVVSMSNNTSAGEVDLGALTSAGEVSIDGNTSATAIAMGSLETVAGDVTITDNTAATTIDLDSLTTVGGVVSLGNNTSAGEVDLGALTSAGEVSIDGNTSATAIAMGSLETVAGDVTITDNTAATTIDLDSLTTVGGAVSLGNNTSATEVDLGALTSAGEVSIDGNTSATAIAMGSLETVAGQVAITGNTSVITIDLGALIAAGAIVISANGVITLNLSALVTAGGDVSIANNGSLLTVDMPNLAAVEGNVDVSDNASATSITFSALSSVGGTVSVTNNTSATTINLAELTTVGGNLDISGNTAAGDLDLGSLGTVSGDLVITENTSATTINVAELTTVGGNLDISGNTVAGSLDLGSLGTVAGDLIITDNTSAATINLAELTDVGGNLDISGNTEAGNLDLGSLGTVSGDLIITDNTSATTINLAELTDVGGNLDIGGNTEAGSLDLGSLETVAGDLNITDNTSATTINLAELTTVSGELTIETSHTVIDFGSLDGVTGDVTIAAGPDAISVDASALGPGGGTVTMEGGDIEDTTIVIGALTNMTGTLTITGAGGVTIAAQAGLAELVITGTDGDDIVTGSATAENIMDGGEGNDTLAAGGGNDSVSGGAGDDTVIFTGQRSDYTVVATANPDEYQITDNRDGPNDGSDIVSGFESFQFSDVTLAAADILNTVPDADADGPYGIEEDTLLSVSAADGVLSGDGDLEGNALTAELVSGPSNALTFTLNADGSFSYQGVADFNGLDSFSYRAFDGIAYSDEITVQINVAATNDAPTVANAIADQNATEDSAFAFTVPAGAFADVDVGDSLALTATLSNGAPLPSWLTFDDKIGAFSGTPLNADVGSLVVRVTATDGALASAFDDFTIVVANTNDAPTANPDTGSAGENETKSFNVLGNDTDPDAGDSKTLVSISAVSVSSGNAAIDAINPVVAGDAFSIVGSQIQFNPGTLFDPLNASEIATVEVNYTMRDDAGVTSSSVLTLTVNGAAEGSAFNVVNGTPGNDHNLTGTAAADLIDGLAGNDWIDAKGGADRIVAGAGNDKVQAGAGDDIVVATLGDGNDTYDGGAGSDTFDFSQTGAAANVSLGPNVAGAGSNDGGRASGAEIGNDQLLSFENAVGGAGADTITGNNAANALSGGAGDDAISGLGGGDILVGGRGSDWMAGGLDADTFVLRAAESQAGDVDTIGDFVVGQDHLLFEGLSVTLLTELDVNGDAVLDTALALSDGSAIRLLGVSGVGTADVLL